MTNITWNIQREGRAWTGDEVRARHAGTPEKLEVVDGRLLWSDEELVNVLGMLLEQAGAQRAVSLGDVAVWRRAVRERERAEGHARSLWKEVLFGPLEPAMLLFFVGWMIIWGLLVVFLTVFSRPAIPDWLTTLMVFGGATMSLYALFRLTSIGRR